MNTLSTNLTLQALDGLALRSTVIAQNIANTSTPNYLPLRVSFEEALRTAAGKGVAAVKEVNPAIVAANGSLHTPELRLDIELADAATTGARYSALLEILNRQMQIDALAASRDH